MVLIYGMVCAIAVALAKIAAWQLARAKQKLETADGLFSELEINCKADEVASGRPADLTSQLRLMKQFEQREAANTAWKRRALIAARYQRVAKWLSDLSGKKLPYSMGLLDMAFGMKVFEAIVGSPINWESMTQLILQLY
ncbi:MAG: hypothetical protein AAFN77_08290 [Planctomycetota bacterium]